MLVILGFSFRDFYILSNECGFLWLRIWRLKIRHLSHLSFWYRRIYLKIVVLYKMSYSFFALHIDKSKILVYTFCNGGNNSAKRIRQTNIFLQIVFAEKWLLFGILFNRISQTHSNYLKPQTYWKREQLFLNSRLILGKTIQITVIWIGHMLILKKVAQGSFWKLCAVFFTII